MNSLPPLFSFIPYTCIPGIVSIGIILSFACMGIPYLHYIHPPTLFLHILPHPTGTNPGKTCSTFLFSDFVKERQK
jgi:hypothetical protein